jgi:hypothetical protein
VEISHKARWAVWGVALALAFVNVTILVAQALDLPSKLRSPPSPGPRFRAAWASHSIIAPEQPYAAESPGSNGPNSRRAQSGQKTRGAVGLSPSRASGRSRPKTASRVARAYVLRVVRGVDGSPLDEGETKWPARSRAQPRIAPRPEEPMPAEPGTMPEQEPGTAPEPPTMPEDPDVDPSEPPPRPEST